jgi:hypothetical protein
VSTSKRIQMSRQHPWRADNPDAVIVARPSIFGNPFGESDFPPEIETSRGITWKPQWHEYATDLFREWVELDTVDPADHAAQHVRLLAGLRAGLLRGRDLACWCPTWLPCHADVLLDLANGSTFEPEPFAFDSGYRCCEHCEDQDQHTLPHLTRCYHVQYKQGTCVEGGLRIDGQDES